MVYTVMMKAHRKPGTTAQHFRDYYETKHVPLIRGIAGDVWPLSHKRHYVERGEQDAAALVVVGKQEDFDYDAMVVMTFGDEAAYQAFAAKMYSPEVTPVREADEAQFIDSSRLAAVILSDVRETTNEK